MNAARAALSSGRPELAERELRTFLISHAEDVDARYFFARSLAALGRLNDAVAEFSRLLALRPDHPQAAVQLGVAHSCLGDHQAALEVLEQARRRQPQSAELHFALGLCQLGLDDVPAAAASFRGALARNMRIPDVYNNLGAALFRLGQFPEAIENFRQSLTLAPDFVSAKRNLGDALLRIGDAGGAVEAYRGAAATQPDDAGVHADLGAALLAAHDYTAAAASLERAIALNGRLIGAAANLGEALRLSNRHENAAAAYDRALSLEPDHAEALLGLGLLAADRGEPAAAARHLLAAWRRKPDDAQIAWRVAETLDKLGLRSQALEVYESAALGAVANADVHEAHGALLHRLGRLPEALACYERGLTMDPGRRSIRLNRGHALESLGSIPEALGCFRSILDAHADDPSALAGSASCALRICDWHLAHSAVERLLAAPNGIDFLHPFLRLALNIDPAALAASFSRESQTVAMRAHERTIPAYSHDRLRVAYLTPDVRRHPVAYALTGVVKRHDRQIIESIGVSLTAPDDSDIARELRASFEEFLDCSALPDQDIVRMLRAREIDIAVDLAGFTSGSRPAIFASRVAAVQLNYLGFPGSTGARFMDFMVADAIVVPPVDEPLYAERIVRLPHSYLPFDRDRCVRSEPARREDYGLPAAGFVFCAFTNGYKISREVFDVWMALLKETPGSVLWLRSGNLGLHANLLRGAGEHGLGADRLIFSESVARMDEHLARLALADLFLDTMPYNAHTTTAEALWAGVPVITCRGRTFAGRVGTSLLSAAGLPELVTESLESYWELALSLARSPRVLAALRERLRVARMEADVFDSTGYVRDFEAALRALRPPA